MKTRFAVVTVAAMLASSLACQRGKDNNLSDAICRVPRMVEPAREDVMGAQDPGQKVVVPKPDAEAHKKEVLKSKPQQVKEEKPEILPGLKFSGPTDEKLDIKPRPLPFRGDR